jgi:hypothetical protein
MTSSLLEHMRFGSIVDKYTGVINKTGSRLNENFVGQLRFRV